MSAPAVSEATVNKALARLQKRTLHAAGRFSDYNFRSYFTKHVADDFARVAALPLAERAAYVAKGGAGRRQLRQMQRMAIVSRLYADPQPVVIDKERLQAQQAHAHPHAAGAHADASPKQVIH